MHSDYQRCLSICTVCPYRHAEGRAYCRLTYVRAACSNTQEHTYMSSAAVPPVVPHAAQSPEIPGLLAVAAQYTRRQTRLPGRKSCLLQSYFANMPTHDTRYSTMCSTLSADPSRRRELRDASPVVIIKGAPPYSIAQYRTRENPIRVRMLAKSTEVRTVDHMNASWSYIAQTTQCAAADAEPDDVQYYCSLVPRHADQILR